MASTLPVGPYRTVTLPGGGTAPFYVIPFDKRGVCEAPQTRAHLVTAAENGDFSDIFLYSHGWNNDWTVATRRYEDFLTGFIEMRQRFSLEPPAGYRPLLVGIFWPSTALTFGEAEEGPAMAGTDDEAVAREQHDLSELGATLPPEDATRFFDLARRDRINEQEARELIAMFEPLSAAATDDVRADPPRAEDLLATLFNEQPPVSLDDFGTVGSGTTGAQTAGIGDLLKKLDPRPLIRTFTVWQMKDRAGAVGAVGVGALLRDLLRLSNARVHLIGHSFGAKVMMSATCGGALPRNVCSALLLQPAMSHLCFADRVPGTDAPGGYRDALRRVDGRILSTFSSHDVPLTKVFHLALRRKEDLGEPQVAAGEPPSVYAALGGFGPRLSGETLLDIQDPDRGYKWPPNAKLIGLIGDRTIAGHGDISNPSTWWALYCGAFRQ